LFGVQWKSCVHVNIWPAKAKAGSFKYWHEESEPRAGLRLAKAPYADAACKRDIEKITNVLPFSQPAIHIRQRL